MKIVILHFFLATILIMACVDAPERYQLSRRLKALRFWPSHQNLPARR